MSFSKADILCQLDRAASDFLFPVLDNGYVYLGAARLTGFRSSDEWAIVIEVLGYFKQEHRFVDQIYQFGNSVVPGIGRSIELFEVRSGVASEMDWFNVGQIALEKRSQRLELDLDLHLLRTSGVVMQNAERIHASELLHAACSFSLSKLWATDDELLVASSIRLPKAIVLNEWEHPDLSAGRLPSQSPSFAMLAEVLATGDPTRYDAERVSPNTHWSNWPDAGLL